VYRPTGATPGLWLPEYGVAYRLSGMSAKKRFCLARILAITLVLASSFHERGLAQDEETPALFPLVEIWRYQAPELAATSNQRAMISTPQTDDLRTYFTSANGTCGALFKSSGSVSWVFHFKKPFTRGLHLFPSGPLVAATEERLFAFDPETGLIIWQRVVPAGISAPIGNRRLRRKNLLPRTEGRDSALERHARQPRRIHSQS